MKYIASILKSHKYAIIWTVCYVFGMYVILRAMFNFDMFSGAQWHHLLHAQLRGFPGFVFGILILAALPMYVATTVLVIRTKKPLFTIPVPKFIKNLCVRMQPTLMNPPEVEKNEEIDAKEELSDVEELPPELPSELRTAYIRARMNITPQQRSAFNIPGVGANMDLTSVAPANNPEISDIPLPSDFDIAPLADAENLPEMDFSQMSAPMFSDVSFDDGVGAVNPIAQYLDEKSVTYSVENEMIVTDRYIIASHSDDDFWICEDDNWFATGKQRTSPIPELLKMASQTGKVPVMYLGAHNIMNLEQVCQMWTDLGIVVITELDKLSE